MQDTIKALQNEMVCINRKIAGCNHDCLKCGPAFEDAEIIAAYKAAIEALKNKLEMEGQYETNKNPTASRRDGDGSYNPDASGDDIRFRCSNLAEDS